MNEQNQTADNTALNVAVLAGGNSAEADVSRHSAAEVHKALAALGHNSSLIELDRNCAATLLRAQPDVVFPALHGPPGEDGTVQGLLEILGLPYVGSGVRGSALAMDKAIAKSVFRSHNLPVNAERIVSRNADLETTVSEIEQVFGNQVAVKPLNTGSALGVQLLPNGGDLYAALNAGLQFGDCLVEPFIAGREITVGVLHTSTDLLAHPVIEIRTAANQWYDYENRYTPGQSEHIVPADLTPEVTTELQRIAIAAHSALGLRDLSRADFILDAADNITLLEVNTLPGMTPTSLYPDGAAALGLNFEELIDLLVRTALKRSTH